MNLELPSPETIAKFCKVAPPKKFSRHGKFKIPLSSETGMQSGTPEYNLEYNRRRRLGFSSLGLTTKGTPRMVRPTDGMTPEEKLEYRKKQRRAYNQFYNSKRKWCQKCHRMTTHNTQEHANSTDGI